MTLAIRAFAAGLAVAALALIGDAFAADGGCEAPALTQPLKAGRLRAAIQRGRGVAILAIGSSSTEGYGSSSRETTYPAVLQSELQRAMPKATIRVENAGIGGETADATLDRLATALNSRAYDLVIWQVGTNDALKGAEETAFRARVQRGIDLAREAKAPLVIVDQQLFPGIKDMTRYERFVRAVADTADAGRVPVFSRFGMMTAWAAEGPKRLTAALSPDQFHMNDWGYACLAKGLAVSIQQGLEAAPYAALQDGSAS